MAVTRSIQALSSLESRVALIVGGAGHVGRVAAEAIRELGGAVVVLDRDQDRCDQVAADLTAKGGAAVGLACDLADEAATRAAVRSAAAQWGRLDIVVHCAAYVGTTPVAGWATPFAEQSVQAWDMALRVSLTSAFVIAQEAATPLTASGHGAIVLVGSIYGSVGPDLALYAGTPMANPAGYGAAKGGLRQLGRYLSTVLAPAVRVNLVSPGGIERGQPAVFQERYSARTPLKRMATEEDIKGAIAYLASDLSAYVTGQELLVDGGWTAW